MPSEELPKLPENQKTFAGIPECKFVQDVDAFMGESENTNVDNVLKQLDEQHSKYKFMEYNIVARKRRLRQQIPDLTKSLDMVKILKDRKEPMDTQTLLSEQVFVKTTVEPTDSVCLWLGANVMLEYSLDEAEKLLQQNLEAAAENLKCLEHDQEFLRDQLTTTEVNMARVYNWAVKKREASKINATE